MEKLKILILEDVPADADLVERELRTAGIAFTAKRVETRASFIAVFAEFKPDIVISNYKLLDFDALSAVKFVRQNQPDLPFVVVTEAIGDEAAAELVKAGASDCVLKESFSGLAFAVQRAMLERQETRRRTHVDQLLTESEGKIRSLVELAGDWIWETDENGTYTYASPRIQEVLGYEPQWLIGKSRFDLMQPTEARRFAAIFADIRSCRKPFSLLEVTCVHKDGRQVTLQSSAVPVFEDGVLKGYCGIDRDITGQKLAEREIAALAHTDTVTSLANRMAFVGRLRQEFARARRTTGMFAVLYLDLDHFKDINDTLGHPAGDALLRAVAERLKNTVRETDTVARFGGDEFAILQPDILDVSDAGALASKILASITEVFILAESELHITASIGVSVYRRDLPSAEAMLSQADLALYRAKDEGRNRFCFHTQDLDDEVRERVAVAEDLHAAIERNELELYYQPQVDMTDNRIVGLEALIRWHHPSRGLVLPAEFIAVAERRGIMHALGSWIFDDACRQIAEWRKEGIVVPAVAINLSAAQLKMSSRLDDDLGQALKTWNVPPESIELEIAEVALMDVTSKHGSEIERVRMLGVRFVVDNFGTGYLSVNKLLAYRFSRLKIAPAFVSGANGNAGDSAIVRAAIGLARELHIDTIAEGVESKDQVDFLVAAGCTIGQGYYFSPPVPAARAGELLRQVQITPAGWSPAAAVPAAE